MLKLINSIKYLITNKALCPIKVLFAYCLFFLLPQISFAQGKDRIEVDSKIKIADGSLTDVTITVTKNGQKINTITESRKQKLFLLF